MGRATSSDSTLSLRYAAALLDVAAGRGAQAEILAQIPGVRAMVQGSEDLRRVLGSPLYRAPDQIRAAGAVFQAAGVHTLLTGLVSALLHNRRGAVLDAVLAAVLSEAQRRSGRLSARVDSADPLPGTEARRLAETLSAWAGQPVDLQIAHVPALLGGVRIRLGSTLIDDSVAGKLDRLRRALV